jgi:opacity protein-like surface antigen
MKTKLAVVMALASTSVLAQDLKLGDLNFFQSKGSVQWNTEVSMTKSEFSAKEGSNTASDFETKLNVWSNEVTYGISDKFRVGLAADYAFKNEQDDTTSGSTDKKIDSDGLSDFSVVSAYRLMSNNLYVDLLGKLTVAMGDREEGDSNTTTSKDGNFKQGHHSLDLGVAVGQMISKFEWRAGFALGYNFAGEYDELSIGSAKTTHDTDARLDMTLNGQVQYRPTSKLAVGLGTSWTKVGEQKGEFKDAGDKFDETINSHSILSSNLVVRYNLSDKMLLNAGYRFTTAYDYNLKEKEADGTTTKIKFEDNKSSTVFLGASFLF